MTNYPNYLLKCSCQKVIERHLIVLFARVVTNSHEIQLLTDLLAIVVHRNTVMDRSIYGASYFCFTSEKENATFFVTVASILGSIKERRWHYSIQTEFHHFDKHTISQEERCVNS